MKLEIYFTEAFTKGPPELSKLGPRAKAKKEREWQQVHRRLKGIGEMCLNAKLLALSHLQRPADIRSDYPPSLFGAFLSDLDDNPEAGCVAFSSIDSLSEGDTEGYFTRYDTGLDNLHCAVLFTLVPTARLVVLGIGDIEYISSLLSACRSAENAGEILSGARGLT